MKSISCDLETYSSIDLAKCGVFKYAESPDFEILLFAYSVDGGAVEVVDLASGETVPTEILKALTDESVDKWAYNCQFERVCLSYWLRREHPEYFIGYGIPEDSVGAFLDPSSWYCSRIWGAYLGLPMSLKDIGAVLQLENQKMGEGESLIRYFCKPCRPTETNGGRTRNLPCHAPEKWELFKKYNRRDVEVELAIKEKLARFPVPDFVWEEYHQDQEINDRGILLDMPLVEQAIAIDARVKESLMSRIREKTGLENPNSVLQMRDWLMERRVETESLDKKAVRDLLQKVDTDVAEVLLCRQQLAKSSVSKYKAMQKMCCSDNQARGCFQFYGASRTGRWSSRGIQLQNLSQNHMEDLAEARALVRAGNTEALELLYDNIPNVLSELVRTAFIPKPGYKYIVADFSAIEARVLSFLAGEQWRIDLFASGGDIYCQSASEMFGVPVVKNGINGHLRQKGKIAELACIAEGSLVLTNHGEKPIETVLLSDLIWDGENWVEHDGVVYRGEREVITYEGLTATPDHFVWVEGQSEPIQFGIAAASGAHLVQSGVGGKAIRLGNRHFPRKAVEQSDESLLCTNKVFGLRHDSVAGLEQSADRKIKGLSAMFPTETSSEVAGKTVDSRQTTLRKPSKLRVSELWCKRDKIRLSECNSRRSLSSGEVWPSRQKNGDRQNRHERQLRSRQSAFCRAFSELCESAQMRSFKILSRILAILVSCGDSEALTGTKQRGNHTGCGESRIRETKKLEIDKCTARLYDIRNAGPNHRFTVSNCLAHNCGYGGSVGALKAMGALEMGLQEEELKPLVESWRGANPNITRFWWEVDRAAMTAVEEHTTVTTKYLTFTYQSGFLFITLPSGRRLAYVKPKIGTNKFGSPSITYMGIGTAKRWERLETYGPKLVENCIQAISRDILAYAMRTLSYCLIVGSVHDELIIECDPRVSLDVVCELMGRTPPWIPGLLLRADGYECQFYQKS